MPRNKKCCFPYIAQVARDILNVHRAHLYRVLTGQRHNPDMVRKYKMFSSYWLKQDEKRARIAAGLEKAPEPVKVDLAQVESELKGMFR